MTSTEPQYTAGKDYTSCPGDAPFAVKDAAGNLIACHSTAIGAEKHRSTLDSYEGPAASIKGVPDTTLSARPGEQRRAIGTERRSITEMEARQDASGSWKVTGYASTFNDPYKVRDQYGTFTEQILTHAWDRSLQNRGHKIQFLALHDSLPYGSTKAKNLRFAPDPHGLGFEWLPNPKRSDSINIAEGIAAEEIDEMSVGMRIPDGGDTWDGDARSISEASLQEISVVARGANPNTEVGMRSDQILAEIRKLEGILGIDRIRELETQPLPDDEREAERKVRYIENLSRLYKMRP